MPDELFQFACKLNAIALNRRCLLEFEEILMRSGQNGEDFLSDIRKKPNCRNAVNTLITPK